MCIYEGQLTGKSGDDSEDAGHCDKLVGVLMEDWSEWKAGNEDGGAECSLDVEKRVFYVFL